jgi:hypothetical protein
MKDDDPERTALREMIAEAADGCTDTPLLDLVYKLLINDAKQKEAG